MKLLLVCAMAALPATLTAATISWTNTSGGNWNTAANWNPNAVPGALDTAVITNNGTYTVALAQPAAIAGLVLGSSAGTTTLSNSSDLAITEAFVWQGGVLRGQGRARIPAAGVLTFAGGSQQLITQTLVNEGVAEWHLGNVSLLGNALFTNAPSGVIDFTGDGFSSGGIGGGTEGAVANAGLIRKGAGTATNSISAALSNTGQIDVLGGALALSLRGTNSGTFSIASGARLRLSALAPSAVFGPSTTFAGDGTLQFAGGFFRLDGAALDLSTNVVSGGVALLQGNTTLSGAVHVSGGTAIFSNTIPVQVTGLQLSGGSVAGQLTVAGPMEWTAGTISTGAVLAASGGMTLSTTADKILSGGALINTGHAVWGDGLIRIQHGGSWSNAPGATFDIAFSSIFSVVAGAGPSGVFHNAGLVRMLAGGGAAIIGRQFNNRGTVQVAGGTLGLTGGGTHQGSFEVPAGSALQLGGTHLFESTSTVAGGGDIAAGFGTSTFRGSIDAGAVWATNFGSLVFHGSVSMTNELLIDSGLVTFDTPSTNIALSSLELRDGSLIGSNNVTVSGLTAWDGGWLIGPGALIAAGGLRIGHQAKTLDNRRLVNLGLGEWSPSATPVAPWAFRNGAIFSNAPGATFVFACNGTITNSSGAGAILNAGNVAQLSSPGETTIRVPFTNSGHLEIQSGGRLNFAAGAGAFFQTDGLTLLNGGTLKLLHTTSFPSVRAPARVIGGTLAGHGTIFGTITNSGVLTRGGSGPLIISEDYVQTSSGAMHIDIGSGDSGWIFDRLVVSNVTRLDGALTVSLPEQKTPPAGTVFRILDTGWRYGEFASLDFPQHVMMQLDYGDMRADLKILEVLPLAFGVPSWSNSVFRAEISGVPGGWFTVLASTNLVQWSPILTNNAVDLPFAFSDSSADGLFQKFYRVRRE